MSLFTRHPENPIVWPGIYPWRKVVAFNPGVIRDDDGTFYMLERAGGSLREFSTCFGLLKSDDGVHFTHVVERPVFTAQQLGFEHGGVQDPRVVKIDGTFYMTFVLSKFAKMGYCAPTGDGQPVYELVVNPEKFKYRAPVRSGIAKSKDLINWEHLSWIGPDDVDDRDNILFPQKVNGKYAMFRRPMHYEGQTKPSIWLSFSDDLLSWSEPHKLIEPKQSWEASKIGANAPPILLDEGWLVTYHGVSESVEYSNGFLLLDRDDPRKVLGRTPEPCIKPEKYYEKFGLVIPNVVFPSGNILIGDTLHLYYGVCDTAIALATAPVREVLKTLQ